MFSDLLTDPYSIANGLQTLQRGNAVVRQDLNASDSRKIGQSPFGNAIASREDDSFSHPKSSVRQDPIVQGSHLKLD